MTIQQERIYRVSKTQTGYKVVERDGHGLAEGVFVKRRQRYFYGDGAEDDAHEWAEQEAAEKDDARVVGLGERV